MINMILFFDRFPNLSKVSSICWFKAFIKSPRFFKFFRIDQTALPAVSCVRKQLKIHRLSAHGNARSVLNGACYKEEWIGVYRRCHNAPNSAASLLKREFYWRRSTTRQRCLERLPCSRSVYVRICLFHQSLERSLVL